MALGGMEQMMVALLGKMGIDPEMVKGVALNVQATTVEMREGMEAIQAKLDRIEQVQALILEHVTPKPDGGFQIGDGSEDDLRVRGIGNMEYNQKDLDHLATFPPGKSWR